MDCNGLVSVIIPVYNVRPYLEEALDSVLAQTYTNLEIIVIDDGSTDGSGQVCDAYAQRDARVQVIHQQNQGLSAARNAGLERMTGEAVAFLDPDDAFDEHFIEAMLFAMIRADADMALCRYTNHATTGSLAGKRAARAMPSIPPGLYDRTEALRALAVRAINVAVWNKLYRRSVWRELRFPVGHIYEDKWVSMSVVDRCERVLAMDQTLYYHRKRKGSITYSDTPERIEDRMQAHSVFSSFVEAHTPGVFSWEQLASVQLSQFKALMLSCIRYASRAEKPDDAYAEELRRRALREGEAIGVQRLEFKVRVAYHMLRLCPWLLRLLYPVYHVVRMGWLRIAGR